MASEGYPRVMTPIIRIRLHKGRLELKIRWAGYSEVEDFWMSEADVDCPRRLDEFIATAGGRLTRVL